MVMLNINKDVVAMNVRVERAKKGLSLQQLSIKSGVGITTLSFVENAKRDVRLTTLDKIAKGLGTTLDKIIGA